MRSEANSIIRIMGIQKADDDRLFVFNHFDFSGRGQMKYETDMTKSIPRMSAQSLNISDKASVLEGSSIR